MIGLQSLPFICITGKGFCGCQKVRNYNAAALREKTLTYQYFSVNRVFVVKCNNVARNVKVVIQ